jgi:hypothetical protein
LWEVEGNAAVREVKARLADGMKLLRDGNWGYSEEPWRREFAEVQKEVSKAEQPASPMAFSE